MNDIEEALKYAYATLAIEGQTLSDEEKDLVRRRAHGELTHEEFRLAALELAKKE